jgi:hypothetical protein
MTFVPGAHLARVLIISGNEEEQWSNGLYFTRANFSQTHLEELVQTVRDTWATEMASFLSNSYATRGAIGYDMRASDAPTYTYTPAPVFGVGVTQRLPIQDALVVTLYTSARGRSGRGRLYVAGSTEGAISNGVFTEGTVNDVVNGVIAVKDAAFAAGWNLVVSSTQQDGVRLEERVNRLVTEITCRSGIPGNQQRRSRRP